jgi:MOSC domain-containing protein YiiM
MQPVGKLLALYISEKETSNTVEKRYIDAEIEGIVHDKHYGKDTERSVLITSIESYTLLETHGITIPHGALGENLLIDYNPYHLSVGTQLKMGDAVLEITQNCTLCKHLAIHDKRIPKLLKDDRGIFAKVTQPGMIKKDDLIYLF